MQITPVLQGGVPGYLLHPILVGVCGDPGDGDSPALQMKEKQHVVRDQTSPGEHFDRKEVGSRQHVHVPADEFLPRSCLTPFGGGWNSVPAQEQLRFCPPAR